jgi:hypothetical protein
VGWAKSLWGAVQMKKTFRKRFDRKKRGVLTIQKIFRRKHISDEIWRRFRKWLTD